MTSVERYNEQGEPIYSIEGGPLKNLWKKMAIINQISLKNSNSIVNEKFDYNEFFKRLYLSRAELDVTNSVLQLLLGENDGDNINLSCLHYDNKTKNFNGDKSAMSSVRSVYNIKFSLINEVSADLRKSVESLLLNRKEEHVIISDILLKLREIYRWSLVRISSPEQIQVQLDYQEMVPTIGIDFNPLSIFKDQTGREQHNYKPHHQIDSENLALAVRNKLGDLSLLFQQKINYRMLSISAGLKNCKTGNESRVILYRPAPDDTIKYCNNNLSEWNNNLADARDRAICLNIMKLLANEASSISKDQVDFDPKNLSIRLSEGILFTINFMEKCPNESHSTVAYETYYSLLHEYLCNSGKSVNWELIRVKILNVI